MQHLVSATLWKFKIQTHPNEMFHQSHSLPNFDFQPLIWRIQSPLANLSSLPQIWPSKSLAMPLTSSQPHKSPPRLWIQRDQTKMKEPSMAQHLLFCFLSTSHHELQHTPRNEFDRPPLPLAAMQMQTTPKLRKKTPTTKLDEIFLKTYELKNKGTVAWEICIYQTPNPMTRDEERKKNATQKEGE